MDFENLCDLLSFPYLAADKLADTDQQVAFTWTAHVAAHICTNVDGFKEKTFGHERNTVKQWKKELKELAAADELNDKWLNRLTAVSAVLTRLLQLKANARPGCKELSFHWQAKPVVAYTPQEPQEKLQRMERHAHWAAYFRARGREAQ